MSKNSVSKYIEQVIRSRRAVWARPVMMSGVKHHVLIHSVLIRHVCGFFFNTPPEDMYVPSRSFTGHQNSMSFKANDGPTTDPRVISPGFCVAKVDAHHIGCSGRSHGVSQSYPIMWVRVAETTTHSVVFEAAGRG